MGRLVGDDVALDVAYGTVEDVPVFKATMFAVVPRHTESKGGRYRWCWRHIMETKKYGAPPTPLTPENISTNTL